MKKSKRKPLPAVVCALIVLILAGSAVLAAYYGKGNFKDVFVNRSNCFTSNMMGGVSAIDVVEKGEAVKIVQGQVIKFCNYDLSTGEYNAFDMTFSIYAWVEREDADKYYDIMLEDGTAPVRLGTDASTPLITGVRLQGGEASEYILSIHHNSEAADIRRYPKLYIYAVPTSPDYMIQRPLGGSFIPGAQTSFAPYCYFDYTAGDDIEDYAALSYVVTTSGRLEQEGNLRICWDPKKLRLVTENGSLDGSGIVGPADGEAGEKYILIPLEQDYYNRLTFLRVQDVAEGETNPWTQNDITWDELEGFVEYRLEYNGTATDS